MLNQMILIAEKAGKVTLQYRGKLEESDIDTKSDATPVTKADLAANKVIVEELKRNFPDIPLLSEESPKEVFDKRLSFKEYFLIDPIDGTKEFIKESGEYTINIAYIVDHNVVAGVVYLPVHEETFYGTGEKSFVKRQGKVFELPVCDYIENEVRVVSSKSHPNPETNEYIKNLEHYFDKVESLQFGSSLKICRVAEGVADLNPRLGGTSEWDIAAAHAVLLGAGGDIIELESGKRVKYNKESLLNPKYEARRKELLGRSFTLRN